MNLKVYLPTEIFLDTETTRVIAEGPQGSFGMLPRHIDYVSPLVPGILTYVTSGGQEHFLALDGGILTKQGGDVTVATRHAVKGELGTLRNEVEKMLLSLDERNKASRSAVARLEAGFLKRFMSLTKSV